MTIILGLIQTINFIVFNDKILFMIKNKKDQGVSSVIGTLLIFSVLTLLFSLFTVQTLPQIAFESEYKSINNVHSDLTGLTNSVSESANTGRSVTHKINKNVNYNPLIQTLVYPMQYETETDSIAFEIYVPKDNRSSDFYNRSNTGKDTHRWFTDSIQYNPIYTSKAGADSTGLEHSITYFTSDSGDDSDIMTNQMVVNDQDITVILYDFENQGNIKSDFVKVNSDSYNKTTVEPIDGDNMTLSFESEFSTNIWKSVFESELYSNGGHITDISKSSGDVELEFDNTVEYDIYMTRATVE